MMKAIFAEDLRAGDIIRGYGKERITIRLVERTDEGRMRVYPEHDSLVVLHTFHPTHLIGLLHRPWLEGKTEEQMLAEVREAATFFVEKGMGIIPLRKTIEAWELGKPLEVKS